MITVTITLDAILPDAINIDEKATAVILSVAK
jgi:hypothetical protein